MTERVHLLVTGHVQGVFYRASIRREAMRLGLAGWVRNLPDGRVEAAAEGTRSALEALVAWARVGPPRAQVDAVEVRWEGPVGEGGGFVVR